MIYLSKVGVGVDSDHTWIRPRIHVGGVAKFAKISTSVEKSVIFPPVCPPKKFQVC